jgi:hypothetical protein
VQYVSRITVRRVLCRPVCLPYNWSAVTGVVTAQEEGGLGEELRNKKNFGRKTSNEEKIWGICM